MSFNNNLPNECIQNILRHVKKSDYNTFHAAILINRKWCQNGIMFLWQQPFNIPVNFKHRYKLISIFHYFFDVNQDELYSTIAPSFNYPSFLKSLHSDNLAKIVLEWIAKHTFKSKKPRKQNRSGRTKLYQPTFFTLYRNNNTSSVGSMIKFNLFKKIFKSKFSFDSKPFQEKFSLIIQSILNVVAENCVNIECLRVGNEYSEYVEDYLLKHECFKHLTTFKCHQPNIDPTIFLRFSNYMQNINTLSITISNNNIFDDCKLKELVHLIDSQRHLQSLSIRNQYNADMSLLFEAMSRKSNTLRKLELISHRNLKHDEAKHLSHCVNLNELSIYGVRICQELDPLLFNSKFYHLKVLKFVETSWFYESSSSSPFISMITNNGALLNRLHLDLDLKHNLNLLRTISRCCLNLSTFIITINEGEMFRLLYPIFKNCKNLKSIHIYKIHKDGITEKILTDFINHLSINLSSLVLNKIKFFLKDYHGDEIGKQVLLVQLNRYFIQSSL
ncbi:17087_t:CDS:1 [Funneliformis caledonium]|uniref:17087_t:CDS:1 n=1 Tax=Funneliformis caledonium TaxID=1117310 RepID=A0A9N8ZV92_9GLOM|nr:17087_t:CDS:1 [Funneliformis caledonium]